MGNRETLLECALRLFAERGYDAVGVQEICAAAGITKPTLYHYFGSKRGLLDALLRECYAPFLVELAESAAYGGDLPRTLERVVRTCFRFAQAEPALWRMVVTLWFASPGSEARRTAAPMLAEQQRILQSLFTRAADDHGNMRGREHTIAATLLGTIHTYVALALAGDAALHDQAVYEAVRQFSHGIYS